MLFNSNLNKIISSFDDLKKISKKNLATQSKAFNNLESWAQDANNTAIHDVTSKLATLFKKFSEDFSKDRAGSFESVSNVFKKFKEYDSELKNLHKFKVSVSKKEKKYFEEIQKCPPSKNIRDYETKYLKAKTDRERAEIKLYEFGQEIDTTKSILFKKNFKNLTDALKRQNEAEKVLLDAMEKLVDQIPDVSNEEVDDICEIKYKNKEQTDEICMEAKIKLTRLSVSSLAAVTEAPSDTERIESLNQACENLKIESNSPKKDVKIENKESLKGCKKQKPRLSCPPKINLLNTQNQNKLYPCLSGINEELPQQPPPTYYDSESFYSSIKSKSSSILPSAPYLSDAADADQESSATFRQTTQLNSSSNIFYRNRNSPTRNI